MPVGTAVRDDRSIPHAVKTTVGCAIVMMVLPGPGWLPVAAALAMLAAQFPWARPQALGLRAASGRIGRHSRR